jgi:hypothetical protein
MGEGPEATESGQPVDHPLVIRVTACSGSVARWDPRRDQRGRPIRRPDSVAPICAESRPESVPIGRIATKLGPVRALGLAGHRRSAMNESRKYPPPPRQAGGTTVRRLSPARPIARDAPDAPRASERSPGPLYNPVTSIPPRPQHRASVARAAPPRAYTLRPPADNEVTAVRPPPSKEYAPPRASVPPFAAPSPRRSTPPPLPLRKIASLPPPPPVAVATTAPPPPPAVEHSAELRALSESADQALTVLHRVVREFERRLSAVELAPATQQPIVTVPLRVPPISGAPASDPIPMEAQVDTIKALATDDMPWDGAKHRRRIAIALTLSVVVGLGGLLTAMTCSHVP